MRDKVAGGWYGAVIGGAWGKPTEFRFKGRTIPADRVPRWSVREANRYTYRGESDETYVEIPFLDATLRGGPGTGYPEWGQAFAATDFELFFANRRARENLRAGIPAPLSGNPANNPFADDIDFQIESDWIGLAAPDQPGAAIDLAWRLGHVTSYGDGVYGGVMIAAMHAAAFRAPSVGAIVAAGREAVPEGSRYRAMIEDVLRWHHRHPRDWKATWRRLERRWNAHSTAVKHTATHREFNIDAKLNGGYVLLGLALRARRLRAHDPGRDASRPGLRLQPEQRRQHSRHLAGTRRDPAPLPPRHRPGPPLPHTALHAAGAIAANLEVARQLALARGGAIDAQQLEPAPSPLRRRRSSSGRSERCRRRAGQRRDQLAGARQVGTALQLVGDLARSVEALQVPGVELAQVARGALRAEVLLGLVDHPEQLLDDLFVGGRAGRSPSSSSKIQGQPSAPRAIITASAPDSR